MNGLQQTTVEIDGVPHIQGHLNEDLYAVPVKRTTSPCPATDTPDKDQLPPGWEKHEGKICNFFKTESVREGGLL